MRYERVADNILDVINRVSPIKQAQLVTMFYEDAKPSQVIQYLYKLKRDRLIDISSDLTVTQHDAPIFKDYMITAIETAHYITASVGARQIKEMWFCGYPTVIAFTTNDGKAYDITYCSDEIAVDTAISKMKRDREIRESSVKQYNKTMEAEKVKARHDAVDRFNHILLVPFEEIAKPYAGCGFDSYCVIDRKTQKPNYFEWE